MKGGVTIYCVCFPGHEPLKYQQYQKNIMCNAASISDQYRKSLAKKGFVFDDVGDNISQLNWTLGDLTATYWIWKNSKDYFVGTSQYRRFWDDTITDIEFSDNVLYVQEPVQLDRSLKEQYIECHGTLGISILDSMSKSKEIPLTPQMLETTYSLGYLYSCNMFIANKALYDNFCEVLFGIVFKIHEVYGEAIKELDAYNRRTPAFLAERIITALIENREHFFPSLEIATLKWEFRKKTILQKLKSHFSRTA
jgi:hypothetical protein